MKSFLLGFVMVLSFLTFTNSYAKGTCEVSFMASTKTQAFFGMGDYIYKNVVEVKGLTDCTQLVLAKYIEMVKAKRTPSDKSVASNSVFLTSNIGVSISVDRLKDIRDAFNATFWSARDEELKVGSCYVVLPFTGHTPKNGYIPRKKLPAVIDSYHHYNTQSESAEACFRYSLESWLEKWHLEEVGSAFRSAYILTWPGELEKHSLELSLMTPSVPLPISDFERKLGYFAR